MEKKNIPYKSFCWVIGTTSFRTSKLNLKIEQQLILLERLYQEIIKSKDWSWIGNEQTQIKYYDLMKSENFLTGDGPNKAKDAREKTSGLVDIGLINDDRTITNAGSELLGIAKKADFRENNYLNLNKDSFVYFKQLLKTSIKVGDSYIRPYLVLTRFLLELGYLSFEEFKYLLPLAISEDTTQHIVEKIKEYREDKIEIQEIIYNVLVRMDNYNLARNILLRSDVTEDLICLIGMNRKSRNYDKPYYKMYKALCSVFLDKNYSKVYELYIASKNINQRPGVLWRNLLFDTTSKKGIKNKGYKALRQDSPFMNLRDEGTLKEIFFKYMHIFKAMATLTDYFDLNRRYFNLTDTLIFEDQRVNFDTIPRYFFLQTAEELYAQAFIQNTKLIEAIKLEEISRYLIFDEEKIYSQISKDLGVTIKTSKQASTFIQEERYRRFNNLIDKRFSDSVLKELLKCFETRNDRRIEELVTDEADIPTIFEYILAIIWYKVSERRGNILEYMKLSLEANLLPKTHAIGGYADIIYEYEACQEYPKHSLLIEATLSDGTNQRRMEMEPVSRHLGDYRIKFGNPFDYSLFISTYLHKNVISDFRHRKNMPYYGPGDEFIEGMKIISLDTSSLKKILNNGNTYRYLYGVFEKYYKSDMELSTWHDNLVKDATRAY